MMRSGFFFLVISSLVFTPVTVSAQTGIFGEWLAGNKKTQIVTYPCVDGGETICSSITWLKNPRKDANNEDPALRERDLIGVEVGRNMTPTGKNRWVGEVYSPKRGKIFASTASLDGDILKIKGCLSRARLVCKTQIFNRIVKTTEDAQ